MSETPHTHGHDHDHDHCHDHDHEHSHEHPHSHGSGRPHVHENQKAVLNRLARAIGHLESVKKMVDDGRDCSEVLVQLSAVRSALGGVSRIILEDHIKHCIVDAVEDGDQQAIDELCAAINKLV